MSFDLESIRIVRFLPDQTILNKFYNNRSRFHEGINPLARLGTKGVVRLGYGSTRATISPDLDRILKQRIDPSIERRLTRSRPGKRLELLLMMGITVPGVGRRLCPLRAIVQIQTSHQLRNLPVLLLFFGQRVPILRAKTQRGQASVTPATMLRTDAVRERPLVQVALPPIDPCTEARLVFRAVGRSAHFGGG